jgi:hypothetical protein
MTELPLREIHLPDPISWWPLAFGWWLALGMIAFFIFAFVIFLRKLSKPTLKKYSIKALKEIEDAFQLTGNASECLSALSIFLRRVAISQRSSKGCAGLTGKKWLQWLDRSLDQPEFSEGIGQILLTGPYRHQVENEEVSKLLELCHQWVRRQ